MNIQKYKCKPVEVQAVEVTKENMNNLQEYTDEIALDVGDWIVKLNTDKRWEVYDAEGFHLMFEPVTVDKFDID